MLWSVINWTTEDHPDFPEFERRRPSDGSAKPILVTCLDLRRHSQSRSENQTFTAEQHFTPTLYLPEAEHGGSGALTYAQIRSEPPDGLACDVDGTRTEGCSEGDPAFRKVHMDGNRRGRRQRRADLLNLSHG